MAAKKETENQKTTNKKQTAPKRPSASSAGRASGASTSKGRQNTGSRNTDRKKNNHVFSFPIAEVTLWGTPGALCDPVYQQFRDRRFCWRCYQPVLFWCLRFYGLSSSGDPFSDGGFSFEQPEQSAGMDESCGSDPSGDLCLHSSGTRTEFLSGRQKFSGFL